MNRFNSPTLGENVYIVHNLVSDKISFVGDYIQFIEYTNKVIKENCHADIVETAFEARQYLECEEDFKVFIQKQEELQ